MTLEEYRKLPETWVVNRDVGRDVCEPVSEALSREEALSRDVYWAVDGDVYWAADQDVYWAVYGAVNRAVRNGVIRAVHERFEDALY